MPYVNVKTAGPLTKEQKQQIAAQISETLEKVANKPKEHTYIVFDEVPRENWAKGDKLLG
ncbi:MAG: 4-oxalocrotonate tautomerase family protein [Candidatus Auribacter fodinae]|jgi:4-oxalocrotonate tautomerase|uniref:4-oxalocrotonate tautomerase family protein n=1 Tax=Candidatus Auribacter fodinae TaxID=2093366 RepID=A0A3A4R1I9_9BACT|nr:MAG: 4-oxalocrotonate tautomerase family protein [Candidatus Auribacter fodinae]